MNRSGTVQQAASSHSADTVSRDRLALVLAALGFALCLLPWLDQLAIVGPHWLRWVHELRPHGRAEGVLMLAMLAGAVSAGCGGALGIVSVRRARQYSTRPSTAARVASWLGVVGVVAYVVPVVYVLTDVLFLHALVPPD